MSAARTRSWPLSAPSRTAPPRPRRCISPDAWRAERAAGNRIREDEVEDFYRAHSLLKRSVFPEDVAEAVYFFASEASEKSTGNIVNVDAGNLSAFTR